MNPDGIFTGWLRHRRFGPKSHRFEYPLAMLQLDVEGLESSFGKSRWWSLERWNLVSFRRKDYLDYPGEGLADSVRNCVEDATGQRPLGSIQIYTQPRFWGFGFNPVSFYWCHNSENELEAVVAEITNTPWNERHRYVLPAHTSTASGQDKWRFDFAKDFHVSPFMPMDLDYRWQFSLGENRNVIHMTLFREGERCFDATFMAERKPFDSSSMRALPLRYPLQCLRVVGGIYWQALRLWLKGIPFYSHPNSDDSTRRRRSP